MLRSTLFSTVVSVSLLILASAAVAQSGQVEFRNYGQYNTAPPPDFREKVDPLINDVITAIKAGGTATVRFDGHADFDAQGDAFTMRKSQERASAAQQAILSQIVLRAGLEGISLDDLQRRLTMHTVGWGTTKALYPETRPMSDRVKNRRVEIAWQTAVPQRPAPPPPPPLPPQTTMKTVGFGIWTKSSRQTVVGEQVVRITVTNQDALPTTFTIEGVGGAAGGKKTVTLLPTETKEVEFSNFGPNKPVEWQFLVTPPSGRPFVVFWKAESFAP